MVTSLNAIHLPSAIVGTVIEQRNQWLMIVIGLKPKTIWHLFSKILMGDIVVRIIGIMIEIVGIMRSTDLIIMAGLGIELLVMVWYLFITYWKVEREL